VLLECPQCYLGTNWIDEKTEVGAATATAAKVKSNVKTWVESSPARDLGSY